MTLIPQLRTNESDPKTAERITPSIKKIEKEHVKQSDVIYSLKQSLEIEKRAIKQIPTGKFMGCACAAAPPGRVSLTAPTAAAGGSARRG
jgi:hypothetical protein